MTNSVSKHYLTYWKSYSLQDALLQEKPIRFIWSQQFAPVNAGDTLWIAGSLLNRFLCLGSITVKRVFERDGRWTIEAETPLRPRIVDLTTMWKHSLTVRNDERTRHQLEDNSVFSHQECEVWFDENNPEWYIIEVDNIPVGYLRTKGCLVGVDIHPEHRNKGYATKAYKMHLENAKFASLWVFADNPAKNIYRKLGFKETGKITSVRERDYIEMEYNRERSEKSC